MKRTIIFILFVFILLVGCNTSYEQVMKKECLTKCMKEDLSLHSIEFQDYNTICHCDKTIIIPNT